MKIWHLRSKAGRNFLLGHPWVYSNELKESPAGIEPGSLVELRDSSGGFLARGYGNPHSLISFRAMTRNKNDDFDSLIELKIQTAATFRKELGLENTSHRLIFGEADGLPGLIIDRYLLKDSQVYVIQSHTAGMDHFMPQILVALEKLCGHEWHKTGIVLKNNLSVRKLEGIKEEEPKIIKDISGIDLEHALIKVLDTGFFVNLVHGQKTGFFLDQKSNIELAKRFLEDQLHSHKLNAPEILDICSYVGQWGVQLGNVYKNQSVSPQVTALDASASALSFTKENLKSNGIEHELIQGDALKDLSQLPEKSFDVIICDPPALIKGRKNILAGKQAYFQLNSQAFRLIKKGGMVITCSCSYLMEESEFLQVLRKSSFHEERHVKWIGRGFQSPDHPTLAEFPEGQYLKAWIGIVD